MVAKRRPESASSGVIGGVGGSSAAHHGCIAYVWTAIGHLARYVRPRRHVLSQAASTQASLQGGGHRIRAVGAILTDG